MPSCLQLSVSSFLSKMLRCRVACNLARPHFPTRCWDVELTATQQVVMLKQNAEIPSCMQLSKSPFPYKMLKFKVGKTSFCHQIFRYWVLGTQEVVFLNRPSKLPYICAELLLYLKTRIEHVLRTISQWSTLVLKNNLHTLKANCLRNSKLKLLKLQF